MGNVIALTKVYIILCQRDEGTATPEEWNGIAGALKEMGPTQPLMRGSWLLSTMLTPAEITKRLSDESRKFSYIAAVVTKRGTLEDTFNQYGMTSNIHEWLNQYLVDGRWRPLPPSST